MAYLINYNGFPLVTATSPAGVSALAWQMLALVLPVPTVGLHAAHRGSTVSRALPKGLEETCKRTVLVSKPSFVTGRAGWPIVPAEMIAEGRMFIWSDGAGGLEKSELPLCRAFRLPTAPVPNHEAVGFDLPPNGGLSTIWRGGFEALHCLPSPPSMVSVVFPPL